MGVRLLENSAWGFDSNCFVCEPANQRGLRIPFAYDDESQLVTAEFTLGPEFSGVPRYVHGGVVLAILDEAMAWAAIAVAGRFAVVHQTATTFDRPVKVGSPTGWRRRCRPAPTRPSRPGPRSSSPTATPTTPVKAGDAPSPTPGW